MKSFLFSLNSTIPIFLVMILGNILAGRKFFSSDFIKVADRYVYKVALPILLFKQIATADIYAEFDVKFMLFCMISTTLMFGLIWLFAAIFFKDKSMVGAFTQASARGSAAILGIAFIENIYGSSGMGPLMIVSSVPLFNIYSVIILTFSAADRERGSGTIKKTLINILKNPILIGIFLGLPFALLKVEIPVIPMKTLTLIAQTATPVALLVVGATFEGKKAIARLRPTIIATTLKLVVIPAVFIPIAVMLGFRNEALVAIAIMLGSPTTVTCYIMAKNLKNDEVLSSSIIVMATLLSSVTLTLIVFILRYNALI